MGQAIKNGTSMIKLTSEQADAVASRSDNTLVEACPGSGKTEVVLQRILWLIAEGASPTDIAVVTYTNSAAREIERRLAEVIKTPLGFVGTLHAFCVRHLHAFGPWRELRVMDDEDADMLLKRCAEECAPKVTWRALDDRRATWHNCPVANPETPVEIAVARYYATMVRTGEVDYDTLLDWTLKALKDRESLRRRWHALIVDEFQDAASIDAEIYRAVEADTRFYVFDTMQSIFKFRGADVGEAERLLADPAWGRYTLSVNFRSRPEICQAITNLASHAPGEPRKPVRAADHQGGAARSRFFDDEAEEAEGIAGAILTQIEHNGPDQTPDVLIAEAQKFAVLARSNRIADRIADEMRTRGVPVCQMKPVNPPKDWKLAMAALGVCARPHSTAAARRYLARVDRKVESNPMNAMRTVTGRADLLRDEMAAMGVSFESLEAITTRFKELPTSADIRDLEMSLALDPVTRRMEGEGVFVGTIHAAKGREWDHVVVAGFEEEIIPGLRQDKDVDEERRLAYVAMSRAREKLILSWSAFRSAIPGGRLFPHNLSRYAAEAGIQ